MTGAWPENKKVVVIVPAYQEAGYIQNVISHLAHNKKIGLIQEIVVVDDRSTDKTAEIARKAGADKVIRMPTNEGKTAAIGTGIRDIAKRYDKKNTIVLFIDADLGEITPMQLRMLVDPLIKNKKINMVIGTGSPADLPLTGERAIRLEALGGLIKGTKLWKTLLKTGYGLEGALDHLMQNHSVVAKTEFFSGRNKRERYIHGKLPTEMWKTAFYLEKRNWLAQKLREQRQTINALKILKEEKKGILKAKLSLAKRRDKMNAQRMLRAIRRVKIKARQI